MFDNSFIDVECETCWLVRFGFEKTKWWLLSPEQTIQVELNILLIFFIHSFIHSLNEFVQHVCMQGIMKSIFVSDEWIYLCVTIKILKQWWWWKKTTKRMVHVVCVKWNNQWWWWWLHGWAHLKVFVFRIDLKKKHLDFFPPFNDE